MKGIKQKFLLSTLLLSNLLMAVDIPSTSDVMKAVEEKVKSDYRDKFLVNSFNRVNGYWQNKEDGDYLVKCNYNLVAKENIIASQHFMDVAFYYRLNRLKLNSNILKDEYFKQECDVVLKHTEQGWKNID